MITQLDPRTPVEIGGGGAVEIGRRLPPTRQPSHPTDQSAGGRTEVAPFDPSSPIYRGIAGWPGYLFGLDGTGWTCPYPIRYADPAWWRRLTPKRGPRGLQQITLRRGARSSCRTVAACILEAHVGPPPPGCMAYHRDGDYDNLQLGNLAWLTPPQIGAANLARGAYRIGERHPRAKLTAAEVARIRRLLSQGATHKDLAAEHDVSTWCIHNIDTWVTWRGVTI